MSILTTLVVRITGDISELDTAMAGAAQKLSQTGQQMQSVGASLTAGITLPLIGAGVAGVAFANEFNAGMANVASLSTDAANAVAEWSPMVQQIAIDTGQSTSTMTEGLYNVVSAFGVADDSLQVLEINAMAASAGLATTSEAIALTSAVTKGYGDTSAEATQQAADLALMTVQLGQTTFPELAASVGGVVPLMTALGGTQEELFAVMATATGVTGGAAEVSTQLAGVLQALMAPTGEMTALMKELGYENGEAMLSGMGLQGTIETIVGAAEATGTPLQKYIGSIEGVVLAQSLGGALSEQFGQKLEALGNAAGAVDEAFAAQTQGVNAAGFQWQQLQVRAGVLVEQFGTALLPAFVAMLEAVEPMVDVVAELVGQFAGLDPQTQMLIVGIGALVAAAGPLLMALGTLLTVLPMVAAGVSLLLGPIGLVIAAVAALGLAWVNDFGGIRTATMEFVEWVQPYIQAMLAQIQAWWAENGDEVMGRVQKMWEWVQAKFKAGVLFVEGLVRTGLAAIKSFWDKNGDQIMATVQKLWEWLQEAWDLGVAAVKKIQEAFALASEGRWREFGAALRKIADGIWSKLEEAWETGKAALIKATQAAVDDAKAKFESVDWGAVGTAIIQGIAGGISAAAGWLIDAAKAAAAAAYAAAQGFFGGAGTTTPPTGGGGGNNGGARGGMVGDVRPMGARGMVGMGGGMGGGITIQFNAPVYGMADFDTAVAEAVERYVRPVDGRWRMANG